MHVPFDYSPGFLTMLVRCGLIVLALTTAAHAQAEELPPQILRPSDYALAQAKAMGGEVFKFLPQEINNPASKWFYSGVGIDNGTYTRIDLGGGKSEFRKRLYYPPSIELVFLRGEFTVGGWPNYGFFTDLGERDLRGIDRTLPEAEYFVSYKPPKLESDIRSEIERLKNFTAGGVSLTRRVSVTGGHTYLLRSIRFDLSDLAVVFQVLETFSDGSITIVWKKLASFDVPPRLHMPDEELQKQIDALLADLHVQDLQVTVKDNVLIFTGSDKNFDRVKATLGERKIPYRGIGYYMQRSSHGIPK